MTKTTDVGASPSHGKENGSAGPHQDQDEEGVTSDKIAEASSTAAANAATATDGKMVKWRGNIVPEKKAKALKHVFDDLQDHFGHQRPDPFLRFSMASPSLRHDQHEAWYDNLAITYKIGDDACDLDYIGMDVCIDMTPKRTSFEDYGKSWVYVYVPELTIEKVKAYVKTGTGWDVCDDNFTVDYNRNLIGIEAKMHQAPQPEPSFWVVTNKDTTSAPDGQFTRVGSVQKVIEQPSQQHVHRGVGIFTVSLEVPGSPNFKPRAGFGEEATLSFTLISVRTWGVTHYIAPIVYSPRKGGC